MESGFLSDREIGELQSWPGEISRSELVQWFTLEVADQRWLRTLNEDGRLGLATHLCALRFLGFMPDLAATPVEVVDFLVEQLQVPARDLVVLSRRRQQQRAVQITRHAGWAVCDTSTSDLARRVRVTSQSMRSTVDHLEAIGAVEHRRHGQGKASELLVTEAGTQILKDARELIAVLDDGLLGDIDNTNQLREALMSTMIELHNLALSS